MMLLTRPSGLEAGEVADFVISPLTEVQRNQFIKRQFQDQPKLNSDELMDDFNLMLDESPPIASMAEIPFFLVTMCTLFIKDDFRGKVSNTIELLLRMLGFSLKTLLVKFEKHREQVGCLVEKVKKQLKVKKLTAATSYDILT